MHSTLLHEDIRMCLSHLIMGIWLVSRFEFLLLFAFLFFVFLICSVFLFFGIYKQCLLLYRCKHFSRIYTKEWNCCIMGYIHFHPTRKYYFFPQVVVSINTPALTISALMFWLFHSFTNTWDSQTFFPHW